MCQASLKVCDFFLSDDLDLSTFRVKLQWLNTYHLYLLSEISGAGDIEHCTQLEATLVERLALARLNLDRWINKHLISV